MPLTYATANNTYKITIPPLDEDGVPTNVMPDCPCCGEGELGTLNADVIMCYNCSSYFYYRKEHLSYE